MQQTFLAIFCHCNPCGMYSRSWSSTSGNMSRNDAGNCFKCALVYHHYYYSFCNLCWKFLYLSPKLQETLKTCPANCVAAKSCKRNFPVYTLAAPLPWRLQYKLHLCISQLSSMMSGKNVGCLFANVNNKLDEIYCCVFAATLIS